MAKTYAEAKNRASGPGRLAGKVEVPAKAGRKLKKDWITEVNSLFSCEVKGLENCTVATLTDLLTQIKGMSND